MTSRRPPIAPKAGVKLVFLVDGGAALRWMVHLLAVPEVWGRGTAGAMGRIELVRLGGLPGGGGSADFCSALSSQEDLVGDQRFLGGESVLVEVGT